MCKFLYVQKFAISTLLKWLKSNHVGYKDTIMNTHIMESLLHDNIPKPIIRSIFQSSNIYLADVEHHTNITYLHEKKMSTIMKMSSKHQD
jgi:hypothetical protein